ncbi:hypothetical protein BCR43DRAFT_498006 [Syncephalastrum racemosum]|uniref:Tho complex subunit 7-domain-containing protein n=1 Tax=Syncephalastrum racemosum TaxID=13706 RepID=A0A1X2H363_SYNRA|nr:hypothetical protein BCR43DRAFT_498006 [Syncephalastrum racemosum]
MDDDTSFMKQRLALDDRPTRILSKKVNNWLTNLPNESNESLQNSLESLLVLASSYEVSVNRHPLIQRANLADIDSYEDVNEKTAHIVANSAGQIANLKEELKEAQRIRDHKLQYDVVAREIMTLDTRDGYEQSIGDLERDIELLKNEKLKKEQAYISRQEKYSALLDTLKNLQKDIEQEREENAEMDKRLMDADRDYESSDEEAMSETGEEENKEEEPTVNGTSHRFKERNDDDEEGLDDEEGMVIDDEVAAGRS